ncbi:MAG: hypothetical protein CME60_14250 [Halobacteriovoraceae bacterium]|nr:hypothetical protein [Halobacteriovoraceae bacterium]
MIIADDFGESQNVDEAIIDLLQFDKIYGVSSFAIPKYSIKNSQFVNFCEVLKLSGVKIGLHYEWNGGSIYKSLKNQIETFYDHFGRLPDYIDSHLHIHSHLGFSTLFKNAYECICPSLPLRRTRQLQVVCDLSWSTAIKQRFFNLFHCECIENKSLYMNDSLINIYSLKKMKDFQVLFEYYIKNNLDKDIFIIHPSLEKNSWKNEEYLFVAEYFKKI